MQHSTPITSEVSLAVTSLGLVGAKVMEWLAANEPALASISYIAAAIAALVTIYFKIKKHGG